MGSEERHRMLGFPSTPFHAPFGGTAAPWLVSINMWWNANMLRRGGFPDGR
ncbi:MAG TPA: hypothetical protein VKV17_17415 [Bryobacteraceae bacterium]|nr:hypothetical protein [Bryobacteraceae bacterium]